MFARKLTGRCCNGLERDGGKHLHAVASEELPCRDKALCGAKPGRLSSGWSDATNLKSVSCGRCLARLARARGRGRDVPAGAVELAKPASAEIRWHWYGEDDGGQVWTTACGEFYLEVNGANGRCEIAEWDADSGSIGEILWEVTWERETVQSLQARVEAALPQVMAAGHDQSETQCGSETSDRPGTLLVREDEHAR